MYSLAFATHEKLRVEEMEFEPYFIIVVLYFCGSL